jgi:hypothetical protein
MSVRDDDEPEWPGVARPEAGPISRLAGSPGQVGGQPQLGGPRHRGYLPHSHGRGLALLRRESPGHEH